MGCGKKHHSHDCGCSEGREHRETVFETNMGCGCEDTAPCAQPYFVDAPACAEDCTEKVFVKKISQVFKTTSSFAMPGCGLSIWVGFDGISDVAVGADMWAAGYGRLKIRSFDPRTQQIELENDCPDDACGGQAAPGTPIPQCTVFIVTPPTCGSTSTGSNGTIWPYLNAGFTAPANGNCLDITVTTVHGLSVGKIISINNGLYRISAILTATTITICNDGDGLAPGVVVDPEDGGGNLIVPIVQIDSNPCNNATVLTGKLLVCHNGVEQPLEGVDNNQVPVYDLATGEVNFRTLGIPALDCTTLTVGLTLDPLLPLGTSYLVTVADTSIVLGGDIVNIGGTAFTVDTVDDGVHLHLIPVNAVGAIQNYLPGASVCTGDCCAINSADIAALQVEVTNIIGNSDGGTPTPHARRSTQAGQNVSAAITPGNITLGAPTFTGTKASLTINNPSLVEALACIVAIDYNLQFIDGTADGEWTSWNELLYNVIDPNPAAALLLDATDTDSKQSNTAGANVYNVKVRRKTKHKFITIAPGATQTVQARLDTQLVHGTVAGANYNIFQCNATITLLGETIPVLNT